MHLRWLTTEKFQNYETVKGGCIPSKNKSKTQMKNKLRWLASVINFKLPHSGCPVAPACTLHKNLETGMPLFCVSSTSVSCGSLKAFSLDYMRFLILLQTSVVNKIPCIQVL